MLVPYHVASTVFMCASLLQWVDLKESEIYLALNSESMTESLHSYICICMKNQKHMSILSSGNDSREVVIM